MIDLICVNSPYSEYNQKVFNLTVGETYYAMKIDTEDGPVYLIPDDNAEVLEFFDINKIFKIK